jgi:hypothetical protein
MTRNYGCRVIIMDTQFLHDLEMIKQIDGEIPTLEFSAHVSRMISYFLLEDGAKEILRITSKSRTHIQTDRLK